MPVAHLADRAVVRVSGAEARSFLDRLITCDLDRVEPDGARFGALLSPQGKIIADFVIYQDAVSDAFLLDTPASCAAELAKRFSMYRLRAKVTVSDESTSRAVLAGWGEAAAPEDGASIASPDPRLPALGWRAILDPDLASSLADADQAAYQDHRIMCGLPQGGSDFAYGDAFPHEALMDQLAGVDFDKGCYVGQEVVSRMQHRGTARTRIVQLGYPGGEAAEPGIEIRAGDKLIGTTHSRSGARGLAMVRLDRLADAIEAGETLLAGDRQAQPVKPDWVRFPYPGESAVPAA